MHLGTGQMKAGPWKNQSEG